MRQEAEDGDWAALVRADCARNAGLPLELLGASGYAGREGITREEYVIRVLRAERERRQAEDAIARDQGMLDMIIDAARKEGIPVVEYALSGRLVPAIGRSRTWDLSPDFLAKLLTRYEERANGKERESQ